MNRRLNVVLAATAALAGWGALDTHAQTALPKVYSFTLDPGIGFGGPTTVKVARDGSKESIDQFIPKGGDRPTDYHSYRLYDFAAHKIYLKILSDPNSACGIQDYKDSFATIELDPLGGGDALLKELAGDKPLTPAGAETVNGIAAKVLNSSGEVSGKVWVAQNGGYPVKIVAVGPDGKPATVLEMKQLSFAKPPASTLAQPTGCVEPEKPIQPSTNVTALTLQPVPDFKGACPAHIKFTGTITVDGPGTVFYQFGAGSMEPGETLTFAAAGTKTVTHTITLTPKYGNDMGGGAILEAIGADASGKHGIPTQSSNNSAFSITCTSGGGK